MSLRIDWREDCLNVERLDLCPVYAALRIRQRALRLAVAADHPIGSTSPRSSRLVWLQMWATTTLPGIRLRNTRAPLVRSPSPYQKLTLWCHAGHHIRYVLLPATCCIDKGCRIHTSSNASAGKASHGATTSATQSTLLPSTRQPSNSHRATFLLSLTQQ